MKCENAQHAILLAESGELSPEDLAALDQHMATCNDCRTYHDVADSLLAAARTGLRQGEPAPDTVARILAAAPAARPRRIIPYNPLLAAVAAHRRILIETMAWAAVALLLVGGWFIGPLNESKSEVPDTVHISALIDLASAGTDFSDAVPADADETQQLQALAQQLLEMEGLAAPVYDDEAISDEAPHSTAPQGNSTPGFAVERCV